MARLRRALEKDTLAAAEVWLRSRRASFPSIPPSVHSDDEVRAWFEAVVIPERETWIAEIEKSIVAVMVLNGRWVDHLYIDPLWTARGIGSRLIELAKTRRPEGLDLWTFESNLDARRFYERHGFEYVERTNGDNNEEGAPDIRYQWRSVVTWTTAQEN